jgi:hypothetical protein
LKTGPTVTSATPLECDIVAHAAVQVPTDQVAPLRRNPGTLQVKTFTPAMLRLADEQTVVAISAVFQAIERHGLAGTDFTHWGILGTPTFLGRSTVVHAILRFRKDGAWGVSPHIIPHRLLHAVSGTLSQVLGVHGPNYGVGGGPDGISEALLTAMTLINTEKLPGLWLMLTGHDPEPTLDEEGLITSPGVCVAMALALAAPQPGHRGLRLRLDAGVNSPGPSLVSHQGLREALSGASPSKTAAWRIDGFGTMTLQGEAAWAK